jgi:MraZ protein
MALISGEYPATLDEKGRLSIPAKFREGFPDSLLVLTKGIERCVWMHTPSQWETVFARLNATTSMSIRKTDMVNHRFIPHYAEIDKAGRLAVPQKLRDFAGLVKDCVVVCDGNRLELWDAERYAIYEEMIDKQLVEVLEEMGPLNLYGA